MNGDPVRQGILKALDISLGIMADPGLSRIVADPARDLPFDQLEIDSLAIAQICLNIEDETGYECEVADFLANPSLTALTDYIAGKLASRNGRLANS